MKSRKLEALLYSLLTICGIAVLAAGYLYGQSPVYDEFVTGVTTWSGYPKQADMQMVQLFLLGLPVCFFLFQAVLKREAYFLEERKQAFLFLKIGYVILLTAVFLQKNIWKQWGVFYALCVFFFLLLGKGIKWKEYLNTMLVGLFSYLSMIAVVSAAGVLFSSYENRLLLQKAALVLAMVSLVVPAFYGILLRKRKTKAANMLFACSKLFMPLAFLGFYTFYYQTEEGAVVQLFYSGKWKWTCILLAVGMVGYEVFRLYKRNYDISIVTVICMGLLRIFTVPDGILNVDFFHMGEMTLPMQQFVSYGKLPYFDLVPIHGLCDYYYQTWNYLFFDGSYLSFNGALVVGNLIFVIFYGILFYYTMEEKKAAAAFMYAFIPFFVNLAGMRYIWIFAFFFVMFSKRAKRNSLVYLWYWVLLSVIAISWNASLGGAAALGFLPAVLYQVFRKLPKELPVCMKEHRKKLLLSYGVLFVVGISFIPLFLKIVAYLRENTGTTLYVNGMEMLEDISKASSYFVPDFFNGQGSFFLQAFCILFSIGIGLYYSAYMETVVLVLSGLVLANYAYVRYEEGLRAKILGIFFFLLTLLFIVKKEISLENEERKGRAVYPLMMGLLVLVTNNNLFLSSENVLPWESIPASLETNIGGETVEDPILYVTKEQTGLANMGTGFVRGNTLNSLNNIEHVLSQGLEGETSYLDLTNGIAQSVILDRETGMSNTSGYNISNRILNEHAIEELKEHPPKLILIAPYIKLDDVPLSLRAMKLYEYIIEEGYEPYQYENVIYMVKGQNVVEESQDGREAFGALMHREYLARLPAVWASSRSGGELKEVTVSFGKVETEEGLRIALEDMVSGQEISYIGISFQKERNDGERLCLEFDGYKFTFDGQGKDYLIPVASSPYWKWMERIEEITIRGEESIFKDDVEITFYQ